MAKTNLLHKNVPRAELDERAREARVRLERLERLLVPRVEAPTFWLQPLSRFVSFRLNGKGQRGGQTGGSMSDPRRGCMPEMDSVSADSIGKPVQTTEATKSPVGAAAQRGSPGCGYTGGRCPRGHARPRRRDGPTASATLSLTAFECRQFRQRSTMRAAKY
jgi:hypothetical protein